MNLEPKDASSEFEQESGLFFKYWDEEPDNSERPLVLLVHGRAGNASVMWIFARSFLTDEKPLIIAPQGFFVDPIGGYSWFEQSQSSESKSVESRTAEIELLQSRFETFFSFISKRFAFDPSKVCGAGFSQGAGVLASLSILMPKHFRGVVMLSGFLPKIFLDNDALLKPIEGTALSCRYFLFHGSKDEILPLERSKQAKAFFETHGAMVDFSSDDVGHKVSKQGIEALRSWYAIALA